MNTLKNLPPWAQSLIALALIAGGALSLSWHAAPPVPRAVTIIGAFCAIVGGALGVGVIKMRSLAPVGLALGLATSAGCGYTLAAKMVLGARNAGDAVAKGMAQQTRAVTAKCLKQCKPAAELDKACYSKCIAPWKVHRERFRSYGAPAISSAVAGGYMAIKLAKEAGSGKDKAIEMAKGVVCAVVKVAEPFVKLIPENFRAIVATGLGIAGKVTCKP